MKRVLCAFTTVTGLLCVILAAAPALAQKQGGILRQYINDSPAARIAHMVFMLVWVCEGVAIFHA